MTPLCAQTGRSVRTTDETSWSTAVGAGAISWFLATSNSSSFSDRDSSRLPSEKM